MAALVRSYGPELVNRVALEVFGYPAPFIHAAWEVDRLTTRLAARLAILRVLERGMIEESQ